MHFLGPCRHFGRYGQADIAGLLHLAAAISGQADDSEAFFTGCIDGFQDVLTVAGRRNADQDVAFFA